MIKRLPIRKNENGDIVPYIAKPGIKTAFNNAVWNSKGLNCLTYALDCPQMGWSMPEQLMEEENSINFFNPSLEPEEYKAVMEKSGFIFLDENDALKAPKKDHIIAMTSSYRNFHFLRREKNGLWTHKNGDDKVLKVGKDYNPIKNPKINGIFNAHVFVGFFKVPEEGIPFACTKEGQKIYSYAGYQSSELVHRARWLMNHGFVSCET